MRNAIYAFVFAMRYACDRLVSLAWDMLDGLTDTMNEVELALLRLREKCGRWWHGGR